MFSTTSSTLLGRGILEETGFDRFVPVVTKGLTNDGSPNTKQITPNAHYWPNTGVFYDENSKEFHVVKKQHTTAQVAAIANATGQDIEVITRVIAFNPNVSAKERSIEGSKVFFKEIKLK